MARSIMPTAMAMMSVGAVLVTGCGAGGGEAIAPIDDPDAVIAEAVEGSLDADSVTLDLSAEVATSLGNRGLTMTGSMDVDGRSSLTVRSESSAGDIEVEQRSDGETTWVRVEGDQLEGLIPDGTEWIRGDNEDFADTTQAMDQILSAVIVLRGASGVEPTGTSTVGDDGVRTFTADVDLEQMRALADEQELANFDRLLTLEGDDPTITAEQIAIDEQGRLRALELSGTSDGDEDVEVRLEYEIVSYDVEVDVVEPKGDGIIDAADVPELLENL